MRIMDYETNRTLNDVGVLLTVAEAEELASYLQRLSSRPSVQRIYLSECVGTQIEREITVSITDRSAR